MSERGGHTRRRASRGGSREFDRIRWMREVIGDPPRDVVIGPGDDAAAWRPPAGELVVLSTDTQIDGVHFRRAWLSPELIGGRALAAAASDLAAMAARPGGAMAAISMPEEFRERDFRALFRGFVDAARRHDLAVLGGNLARGPLAVTTTVVGSGRRDRLARRDGARQGDAIFVTGWPGRARIALALLEGRPARARRAGPGVRVCLDALRRPAARVREALAIARAVRITAMIDVSDGLGADLGHILEESGTRCDRGLGAVLDAHALGELLEAGRARDACESAGLEPLDVVLEGGEDFELVFTVAARDAGAVSRCAGRLDVPLTRIGTIAGDRAGIAVRDGSRVRSWRGGGWDHFR